MGKRVLFTVLRTADLYVFINMRWSPFLFLGYNSAQTTTDCKNQNEKYTDCGTPCEEVCGEPIPICMEMCLQGCFCETGYVRDALGMCISNDECKKYLNSSECEKQLISANANTAIGMVGGFTPSCEREGHFSPVQCHGSIGYCWCAEQDGTEIKGTRIRGEPVCSKQSVCETQLMSAMADSANGNVGGFMPSCEPAGQFSAVQCHGSIGYCWCAERDGTEITGSRIRGEPVCNRSKTCQEQYNEDMMYLANSLPVADFYPANCQKNNPDLWEPFYENPMMWPSQCMCLSPETGKVVKSEQPCNMPCTPQPACGKKHEHYDTCGTACQEECGKPSGMCAAVCVEGCFCDQGYVRDYQGMCVSVDECFDFIGSSDCIQENLKASTSGPNMVGVFTPSCEPNGHFSPRQCHGSTGQCWCAERDGTEITGSRIRGEPVCNRQKTCQEQYKEDMTFLENHQVYDFIPANCQSRNPDLWVPLVNDPNMYPHCMCKNAKTGEVDTFPHPCNQPCNDDELTFWPARDDQPTVADFVELIVNILLKLFTEFVMEFLS